MRGVSHRGKEAASCPSRFGARLEAHFSDLVKGEVGDVLFVLALEADQALSVVTEVEITLVALNILKFWLVHHQHPIEISFHHYFVDALVRVAELYEFNLLVLRKFQLVAGLRHLFAFVDLGHLDAIKVVGHADALDVAISHEDLYLIEVEVGCLHEKEGIVKGLLPVLLQLVLSDETLRGSTL